MRAVTPIKVMGLDLAAVNSGLCVIEAHHPEYAFKVLHEEAFRHPKDDFRNRIAVSNSILGVARTHNPTVVAIEDYARRFGRTNTSGIEHAEVGGMTKKTLHEAGFRIFVIPPTSMRSFMGAPPKSPKDYLIERAKDRLGYESDASNQTKRSNITDALIHAHIGALLYLAKYGNLVYDLTKAENRILYGDKKLEGLVDRSNIEYGAPKEE